MSDQDDALGTTAGNALPAGVAALLDLDPADRAEAEQLMGSVDIAEVDQAIGILRSRLGTFPSSPPVTSLTQPVWICALLRFAPELAAWHRRRRVGRQIRTATMADFGRQFRLHRITHGSFGLETWGWLTWHCAGGLVQLGRLHFLLRRLTQDEPAPPGTRVGNWVLDVHIPPIGPLRPDAVADAFRQAAEFFPDHFPEHPASVAVCFSWLLDPYLGEHLPAGNIAAFQREFQPFDGQVDRQEDALYFVFRTRRRAGLADLPRKTSLQILVLDRIEAGGVWQAWHGWRLLPDGHQRQLRGTTEGPGRADQLGGAANSQ